MLTKQWLVRPGGRWRQTKAPRQWCMACRACDKNHKGDGSNRVWKQSGGVARSRATSACIGPGGTEGHLPEIAGAVIHGHAPRPKAGARTGQSWKVRRSTFPLSAWLLETAPGRSGRQDHHLALVLGTSVVTHCGKDFARYRASGLSAGWGKMRCKWCKAAMRHRGPDTRPVSSGRSTRRAAAAPAPSPARLPGGRGRRGCRHGVRRRGGRW